MYASYAPVYLEHTFKKNRILSTNPTFLCYTSMYSDRRVLANWVSSYAALSFQLECQQ